MDANATAPTARIDRLLRTEPVVWLSSVRPDGAPHLVPIWFSWDGRELLIASKPHAQKVRNIRSNPSVMLALGAAEDDFDVGLLEGRAEALAEPASRILPRSHLTKYRDQMGAIGLTEEEFLATYSLVIRVTPTRFLPWHGRTVPASLQMPLPSPPPGFVATLLARVGGVLSPARRPVAASAGA